MEGVYCSKFASICAREGWNAPRPPYPVALKLPSLKLRKSLKFKDARRRGLSAGLRRKIPEYE
jgi:hypothetical protein